MKINLYKNITINILDYLFLILLVITSSRIVINSLGEELYGLYSTINVLLSMTMLIESGVGLAVVHFISNVQKYKTNVPDIIGSALIFYILISLVLIFASILYHDNIVSYLTDTSTQHNVDMVSEISYLLPYIILSSLLCIPFTNYFVSNSQWLSISILNNSSKLIYLFLLFLAVDNQTDSLINIFYLLLGTNLLKLIISFILYFKNELKISFNNLFSQIKLILSYSKYSSLQLFSAVSIFYLDKLYIKEYFSLADMGYFTFCFMFGTYIHSLYNNVYRTFFPKFLQESSTSHKVTLLFRTLIFFFLGSIIVSLISYYFWETIIGLLINKNFANMTLNIFAYVLILSNIRILEIGFHYFYHGIGKPKILAIVSFITSISLLLLYSPFISFFGIIGTLVSQIIIFSFIYFILTIYTLWNFKWKNT
ncbi:lipopolysaccharide biosynthesis protein [Providencia rettgeri]|uniref:lipopolysaccharide biosynthesis protein n=1 Tax=Providencia TaxID=586 RepID=UPI00029C2A6A|nr:hypothetical protein OOC_02437 [Providencia rettgeri Dmel1]HEM7188824.1 oligosaccharide flippase family protein [Providencia rettgeri]